ncbi:DUF4038 domain-containing protein, partial [bacterium]|nr:DUF4038 domain-containing protein [bacterium]
TYEHPDLDHIRYIENFIRYANSKGITVWINPWWIRKNLAETVGEQNIIRWWRYVVHRLGAYNVIWVLAGEYNMYNYGGLGLDFFKELGNLVKNEDPYKRITSSHNTPPGWSGGADAPQWSTADCLHNEEWLDYNQCQVGHGNWRNEMIPEIVTQVYQQQPYKPIVVTEPWYEFIEGSAPAEDIRFGAWSAMLSGAAGHSYAGGHIWKAHLPESPVKNPSPYPMDMSFSTNTLDYPGASSFAFMAKFLSDMEWWKLEPCPELISGNPSKFCSANPGVKYLVYLRWGGTVNINLTDAVNEEMNYEWIDLTTGEIKKTGSVKGNKMATFLPPESYPGVLQSKDWILHIYK